MTYVWLVKYFAGDKCRDLADVAMVGQDRVFSTEAKALAHAASLREDEQYEDEDDPLLVWHEKHEAPDFCWHTSEESPPSEWEGIIILVTRVTLE